MKITDHKVLIEFSPAKVQFFRIDPEDISVTLKSILRVLMDLSWLSKFDQDFEQKAFESRATKTIEDIKAKFDQCVDDGITKDAGEYVVSELARETMISKLDYLDIPLAELVGKKRSGNPGFDFHSQNKTTETVVLLSKGEIDSKKVRVEFSLEDMDMSGFQKGATYEQIKAYVLEHTGLKVSSLYISQIKRKCGLDVGQNYNLSKKEDAKVPKCPPEKEAAIRDALKYFQMI